MFSRWGKSKSSKESKKKSNVESLITSLHRKITAQRHRGNSASKSKSKSKSKSRKYSRSPSPSKQVACCHSFDEGPPAQSLPHPSIGLTKSCRVLESGPPLRRTELLNLKASAVIGEAGDDPSSSYSSDSDASVYEPNSPLTLQPAARSPKMLSPCRSPNRVSRNNSFTEDMPCELFCPQNRGSSRECSPLTSPRMMSPGPGSRIQSGRGSPLHPRAAESPWPDDGKKQSYPLPLPPIQISLLPPFSTGITSPKMLRSPGRTDNPPSPTSCWKKGRLLGRGTFGHVYLGFNSGSGEMCAMKEVTLFADDAKSKECVQQLKQEISLLRHLRHPNIVQYYDSEMVDDKLYIYLEYVSGGSIHRILQEYGHLGEAAIRSYTQQILSGLAYLHAKNTLHRDIKGANILVDPNGRVRLADFGMAKHITGKSCPLSFKGSPYWMAPEVIKNSSGCNLAVDIWSLGCTVLEMATTKPPWSQYEGVAALFKVGNSKELPEIPDHLSDEGKDFVMQCLQRNPSRRPTALQLLEHPFVKNANLLELTDPIVRSNSPKIVPGLSDPYLVRNISCPVSPTGNSPQHHMQGRLSSPRSGPLSSPGGFIHPHKPNAFRVLQKTRSSVDSFSRDDDYLGNNAIRPLSPQGQLYDAHFVLASRVSQQLLGSPIR